MSDEFNIPRDNGTWYTTSWLTETDDGRAVSPIACNEPFCGWTVPIEFSSGRSPEEARVAAAETTEARLRKHYMTAHGINPFTITFDPHGLDGMTGESKP